MWKEVDVVAVGGGPAGVAAALAIKDGVSRMCESIVKGGKLMGSRKMLISVMIVSIIGFLLVPGAMSAPEKRLIIAVGHEPGSLDQSLVSAGADSVVVENWGEFPIYRVSRGDLKPGLATSWKMSPDGKEIEFTLRKGVKFHSGDLLTVKDVQFSFERGMAKNPLTRSRLKSVERFEVIDDYRYKIHFKMPDVLFIPNRGGMAIVSKSYYERVGEDKFIKQPVGTGPYKFVRHASGEYVDMERFEEYWGEKPSVKEARFYFVPEDTTRLARLKTGEVDLIGNCPYPSVKDIEKSPGLKVVRFASNHPTVSVVFSNRNPKTPWHDRRVRLAMAHAIDCNAIIKNVLHGIPNHWAFFAPHELGYDPNFKHYPYDPKKARELLAEAGYPKGFELKLYWRITGTYPMSREVTEAAASYLEAIDIRTKLVGEEYITALSRQRAAKSPEAEYVGCFGHGRAGGSDPISSLDIFYSKDGAFSVYSNPELEKVIAEARTTVNDTKRGELIKKAVRMIQEDVASIPIYNTVVVYAMKENINFNPTQKQALELVPVKDVTMSEK